MKLPHGSKVRPRWWSFVNWTRGLKWSPVGRYRCCDHTTPHHYGWCPMNPLIVWCPSCGDESPRSEPHICPPGTLDYDGPDPSVECAYSPCTNRLRQADHGGEQWCSKAHREATHNARSSDDG